MRWFSIPRGTPRRRVLVAAGIAVSVILGVAGARTAPPATAGSYNPGANLYRAPLSDSGLLAVTDAKQHMKRAIEELQSSYSARSVPAHPASGASAVGDMSSVNPGSGVNRFIDDSSYMPQSETAIAVDPSNSNHVLGAFNDSRFFFCPFLPQSDCPSGYDLSLSGFSVSTDGGATVAATGTLPGLREGTPPPKNFLVSWGDPSVAATVNGNFFYSSLAIDPITNANGVMLAVSNSTLLTNPSACKTPRSNPASSPCWKAALVFGATRQHPLTFEDKPMLAVDRDSSSPYYGDAYIGWDHYNPDGTSQSYLARCTPQLACQMLAGGGLPPLSGSDPFAGFTTPVVASDGTVDTTWCNFGTPTALGPIDCKFRSFDPVSGTFGAIRPILSLDTSNGLVGYATEQFRTANVPSLAIAPDGTLYFVIDSCSAGSYFGFAAPNLPGNCGSSEVMFSKSVDGGTTWSSSSVIGPTNAVTAQPWVTVDASNGNVDVVYYSSEHDPYAHRLDVIEASSADKGGNWSYSRLTPVSIEPDADPAYYDPFVASGFGGSFVVPQFGDYMQATAQGGVLRVLFSGTYASEEGTLQTDPFIVTGTS